MKYFIKISQQGIFIALLLNILMSQAIAGKYEISGVKNYTGKMKVHTPVTVNLEVNGVELDSVFFDKDKMQAFIILRNRTPVSVNPTVGISVFDKNGKVIATGIDVSEFSFTGASISAGDQKNVKLSFKKFITNFNDADKFQVIFSLGKEIITKSSDSSSSSDDDW